MGSIKKDRQNAINVKVGKIVSKKGFGTFVVVPTDEIIANRSSAYAYMF